MHPVFTQFGADSTSGIGALGVSGSSLLIQLITFLLAYLVLRKYAFQPILRVLQQRREVIESGVKLGEEMQKERAALDAKVTEALKSARLQADGIIAEANDAAQAAVRAAEDKARAKADNIVKDAAARTAQDAARVRAQIEKEVVSLISDATEAIIDEKLDDKKDAALINRVLKEQRA
jgi:F-type H+-transporting ATPase subunit b